MSKPFSEDLRVISLFVLLALQFASVDQVFCADTARLSDGNAGREGTSRDGSTFMYDYFDASNDAHIKKMLGLVNASHMDKKVFDNIKAEKYQPALKDIDYTLRHFPNHPMGLQLLTTVALLSKNKALPIRYFEKATGLYPSHSVTHAQYGWYLVTIGNLEYGIEKLNYAVQLDPKLIAGYVWLAKAYEKKGDVKSAREAGERAKELGYNGKLSAGDPGK